MSAAPPLGSDSASSENDGSESAQTGAFSMMDMLMNMLTPEQKAMYEMFQQNTTAADSWISTIIWKAEPVYMLYHPAQQKGW